MSKLQTPRFRVAYPSVFQAKRNTLSGKDEFSVVALFPKDADLTELKNAAMAALTKKFGEDQASWPENLKSPFKKQGDRLAVNKKKNKPAPGGYEEGAIYMDLKSEQRPGVVDNQVQPIIDTADFYAGCWAIASVSCYGYDHGGNTGVGFGLGNIQKVGEGDRFGSYTKPEDDFKAVDMPDAAESTGAANTNSLFN